MNKNETGSHYFSFFALSNLQTCLHFLQGSSSSEQAKLIYYLLLDLFASLYPHNVCNILCTHIMMCNLTISNILQKPN